MAANFFEKEQGLPINISTSGDNQIIAAPGNGYYLAIDFLAFIPTTAATYTFKSGSTNLSGPLPLASQQALTWENSEGSQDGRITCRNNESFVINIDGNVQTGGMIRYRIIGF